VEQPGATFVLPLWLEEKKMSLRLIAAAGAIAVFGGPALAADIPVPAPVMEAPAYEPVAAPTWSGIYLGALLGYTWGDFDSDAGDVEGSGIDGGVYAGANYQFGNFVVGVEGDALASGVSGDDGGVEFDQGFNGSLRARAGIALDQFLLYGTGGAAVTQVELDDGLGSDENTLWGWTAGAGTEALITEHITARVEYRYTDYQDKTFTLGGGDADGGLSTHSVRAGVGVKF